MVVDAVGEPDPLGILEQRPVIVAVPVALVAGDDGGQGPADAQVVLVILVPDDVPTGQRGLRKEVGQLLLLQRHLGEAGHPITQHLHIGESVDADLERRFGRRYRDLAGGRRNGFDGRFRLAPAAGRQQRYQGDGEELVHGRSLIPVRGTRLTAGPHPAGQTDNCNAPGRVVAPSGAGPARGRLRPAPDRRSPAARRPRAAAPGPPPRPARSDGRSRGW